MALSLLQEMRGGCQARNAGRFPASDYSQSGNSVAVGDTAEKPCRCRVGTVAGLPGDFPVRFDGGRMAEAQRCISRCAESGSENTVSVPGTPTAEQSPGREPVVLSVSEAEAG